MTLTQIQLTSIIDLEHFIFTNLCTEYKINVCQKLLIKVTIRQTNKMSTNTDVKTHAFQSKHMIIIAS